MRATDEADRGFVAGGLPARSRSRKSVTSSARRSLWESASRVAPFFAAFTAMRLRNQVVEGHVVQTVSLRDRLVNNRSPQNVHALRERRVVAHRFLEPLLGKGD